MSNIAIKGGATGTAVFTLESPATNTDRTLTIPDVDGSIVTANASGNVGIGTSSPTNKLHVVGTAKIEGSTLDLNDAGTFTISQNTAASALVLRTATSSYMRFDTNGANERMRIESGGNLLLGTTASLYSIPNGVAASGSAIGVIVVGHASGVTSGNGFINFNYNTGAIGSITQNGTTGVSYNTSSDYRLKEDWVTVANASTRVNALKPINFAWKADGSRVDGFLAHELAEVVPEAVTGTKDAVDADGKPVYQGIDQSKLVPLLTAALQEALARIETLEADVATLKGAA